MVMGCQADMDYQELIMMGEFNRAAKAIRKELRADPAIAPNRRLMLEFELERMERIRKDFTATQSDVMEYIRQYLPEVKAADLQKWEKANALEYKIIDGEKWYFHAAARNLFRIDPELKQLKKKRDAATEQEKADEFPLDRHLEEIIQEAIYKGQRYVKPVTLKIRQAISVDRNAVPPGEMLRCWIPFPREIPNRQTNIEIIATDPARYILADNDHTLQRTIYFEKLTQKDTTTEFAVEYRYTVYGVYAPIDPQKIRPIDNQDDLLPYLQEVPPHIVFSDELRELSATIVGDETNPYHIAQKLFAWIDSHIPWASAREYSTFYNIPSYVIENGHGDCGMMTLTFMTLCRLNGIPTKWQSGWEFQPPDDSMHDWGEIYFEPYGWVPMDVTYGLRDTEDERLKWFYLNGMDSYRLIYNDDYGQPFYPAKIHPRSETVDSQRGEVEWRGGNLYFDQWDWQHDWEVLKP